MRSLRFRLALWFAAGVLAVMTVFVAVTFSHLRHELRVEHWERTTAVRSQWGLHGSFTEAEVADIVGELWYLSIAYALPVLVLAMGAGYFVARRAMRPVADMSSQLQRITAANLGERVNVVGADQEFREVGRNVNDLLARLDASFRQLSDYSAQVAHELRTPLTLMRLQIEESAGRIEPALAESMQEELKRLSDYAEQCLLLATAEQGRLQVRRERVALDEVARDVVEAYALLAREESRTITLEAGPAELESDPRYLRQLLHTLLSNSLRHGTGPIAVSVGAAGTRSLCRITNAVAPGHGEKQGAGLGLRLGRALAATLGLQLQTGRTPDGAYAAHLDGEAPARTGSGRGSAPSAPA